jgi:uncharacterized protein YkwD
LFTVRAVSVSTAAVPARLAPALIGLAVLGAALVAGQAAGARGSWGQYLAPVGLCQASGDRKATPAVQARSLACLVNWARAQDGRARLVQLPALRRAAALKGDDVVACEELSHTPCGTDVTSAVRAVGYSFATFGENLFAGRWGHVSARDVVAAWLRSPSHRANMLDPDFRHLGAASVRAPGGRLGDGDAVVWVAVFASPADGARDPECRRDRDLCEQAGGSTGEPSRRHGSGA